MQQGRNVTTTVINQKDAPEGWINDPQYVYIGRGYLGFPPSVWGNPFTLQKESERASVLVAYLNWVHPQLEQPLVRSAIRGLRGKILVCWCWPKLCHGDILALLADAL